jgi:N-acetyl-gamma-glutamyl-phosphate reductase
MYTQFYANSAFVEVLPLGTLPRSASVAGTNRAQIGLGLDTRVGMLVALGAIDNLCKGAAGQAVQCANIVFGLDEACGLKHIATAV